jgi:DNA gyrase subunit A
MKTFGLTEKQAQVILDMRLKRLTALEREKIDEEYEGLLKKIEYYQKVLSDEQLVLSIIREEILEIKQKYGDERRTRITHDEGELDIEDLIVEEDVVLTQTHFGYVKRLPLSTYRNQRRGGRGVTGITTREEDFVERIFVATTHHVVMFFTDKGNVYKLKAYEIPESGRTARGTAIVNLLPLKPGERVNAMITIKDFDEARYLIFATKNGTVKKTLLSEYASSRKTGLIAITLKENDELIGVRLVDRQDQLILGTHFGMSIRFSVDDVSSMGRTAQGVKGINLRSGDKVVSMDIVRQGQDVLVVTEQGFGKRTDEKEFRCQARGGKGVIIQKITDKTGPVAGLRVVGEHDEVMLCTTSGIMIRMLASGISKMSRNTRGVKLIKLEKDDLLASMAVVTED